VTRIIHSNRAVTVGDSEGVFNVVWMLATVVRFLSATQVAARRFAHAQCPEILARQWLGRHSRAGWCELRTLMLHPLVPLPRPLLEFNGGDEEPNFAHLARAARGRWTEPPRPTLIATATRAAIKLYGGRASRPIRACEADHDHHVASLYLAHAQKSPELAWTSEDELCRLGEHSDGESIPDALVIRNGVRTAIEFAGRYRADKLRLIHRTYASRYERYELW
jgi:hypothetical protein